MKGGTVSYRSVMGINASIAKAVIFDQQYTQFIKLILILYPVVKLHAPEYI
jgi:hypothetical protein